MGPVCQAIRLGQSVRSQVNLGYERLVRCVNLRQYRKGVTEVTLQDPILSVIHLTISHGRHTDIIDGMGILKLESEVSFTGILCIPSLKARAYILWKAG